MIEVTEQSQKSKLQKVKQKYAAAAGSEILPHLSTPSKPVFLLEKFECSFRTASRYC